MDHEPETSASETFIHELRNALNHLYDPDFLRASPMAILLGVSGRFDTPSALQAALTKAIESLKPAANVPNKPYAQGIYDLLLYRYVQQFTQNEIANQLGISVRQLRRQQNLAIYELADKLWAQYQLGSPQSVGASQTIIETTLASAPDQFIEELEWLKQPSSHVATDLSVALEAAHLLIRPLVEQKEARLVFPMSIDGLAQVHPVAFQQILLTLLTVAIHYAPGQEVQVKVRERQGWQSISISTTTSSSAGIRKEEDIRSLETVKKMVELSNGSLTIDEEPKIFIARVTFPSVIPLTVLVIDDNPEIITMMQRFSSETRYRIIGLTDPITAIAEALKFQPDLIIIDIMMPQVDGLQVLSRFKHHPELGKLPVIICSVLPQKDLATSLGAVNFIQKPIKREEFILTLEKTLR